MSYNGGGIMRESAISKLIQLAATQAGCRLFRNTVGRLRDPQGRMISFGIAVGSSDLIGWCSRGGLAVFLAVEVKSATGRLRPQQRTFLDAVRQHGGIAIVARSVDEFHTELILWERQHGYGQDPR